MGTFGDPGDFANIALSPDGRRVVATRLTDNVDIWVVDAVRNVTTRMTFDPSDDYTPVWSPDGASVAFASDRMARNGVFMKSVSGAGSDSLLFHPSGRAMITDWSRDGRFILGIARAAGTNWDVWAYPLDGSKPFAVVTGPAPDMEPALSPDGRWVAYSSNESGRAEIYLQSFDGPGGRQQVSNQGGRDPRWRGDGREL